MPVSKSLENRFRQYFHFFDLDKDGFLTSKDFDIQIENLKLIYEAGEEDTEKLRKLTRKWWDTFNLFAVNGKLTEDAFVQSYTSLFEGSFAEDRKNTYLSLFGMMDRNQDNKLSRREFLLFYKVFNVTNIDQVDKIFTRLDVYENGFLTREEWVTANVNYFTRDDPNEDFGFLYRNLKK